MTARTQEGVVMAVRHRECSARGRAVPSGVGPHRGRAAPSRELAARGEAGRSVRIGRRHARTLDAARIGGIRRAYRARYR